MSTENVTPKHSPFMSMFGRKKRVNGTKSADDIRGTAAALAINNGQTTINGRFIDADADPLREVSTSNGNASSAYRLPSDGPARYPLVVPSNSTFGEKVRFHRSSRAKHSRDVENGPSRGVSTQASTLPGRSNEKRSDLNAQQKAWSADAVCMYSDSNYLMEALETLGEEQPLVARSIPKHAVVDTSKFRQRSLDNCLFDASVYDGMLFESLKVCELLQNHLTACIVTVRAKSPEGRRLECVSEETEEESEASGGDGSQQTVIESKRRSGDPNRLSTLTNETTASSIDSRQNSLQPPESRRLKSIVQYQC